MYTDPQMALQVAKERQARLRAEAEGDRLAAQQFRRRTAPLLLRLSNLLLNVRIPRRNPCTGKQSPAGSE
jgi:hypothetical protein